MKKALVTGSSRGIGAAEARALAADGWRVTINYLNSRERAEALAAELGTEAVRADVCLLYTSGRPSGARTGCPPSPAS